MRKIMIVFLILLVFIVMSVVAISILREPICRGKILPQLRGYCYLFFRPTDLYEYRLHARLLETTDYQRYTFSLKYIGTYVVGITLDNFTSDSYFNKKYYPVLKISIDFYDGQQLLCHKDTVDEYHPFLGKETGGYTLFSFISPQDIPIDRKITCNVKITVEDNKLFNEYGPAKIFIRKDSEL